MVDAGPRVQQGFTTPEQGHDMKLATFKTAAGPSWGVVIDGGIADTGAVLHGRHAGIRAVLCSTFTRLEPGDVIVTGTPGGVGSRRVPPLWLKPGDIVEIEIDGVGVLRNPVTQEA